MKILIKNLLEIATSDQNNSYLRNHDILIEGNRIKTIGKNLEAKVDLEIDGKTMVALPGMVNTHHHLYQTLFRNLPLVQNVSLFDWLINLYEGWRYITPEAVHNAALTGLGELLLTGCTLASDHHYLFPQGYGQEMLAAEIEAARQLGIRFYPTRGSMSRGKSKGGLPPDDVVQSEDVILQQSEAFINQYHNPNPGAMTRVALAPCSPFSVTAELLSESAKLARKHNVRLHTHLAETKDEEQFCLQKEKMRPLEFMESVDWLGDDVWYAHGIWFNEEEIKKLGKTGTGVAHCPSSNMRLGSGICHINELRKVGAPVGLAVDGSASNDSSDMLAEARQALLLHRIGKHGVSATNVPMIIDMATCGGAKVLGWEDETGSLAPGYLADLALFDLNDIAYAGSLHDPSAALLFNMGRRRAAYVFVDGKMVVKEGELVNVDEKLVVEKQNKIAAELVDKAKGDVDLLAKNLGR
jgi:8-oxoguanine deaminase